MVRAEQGSYGPDADSQGAGGMKVTEHTSDLVAFASVRIHSTVCFSGQWFPFCRPSACLAELSESAPAPMRVLTTNTALCSRSSPGESRAKAAHHCTIYSSPKLAMEQVSRFSLHRSQTSVNSEFVFPVWGVALFLDGDFSYKMRHAKQYRALFFFYK